jgi:hypothetical protein
MREETTRPLFNASNYASMHGLYSEILTGDIRRECGCGEVVDVKSSLVGALRFTVRRIASERVPAAFAASVM